MNPHNDKNGTSPVSTEAASSTNKVSLTRRQFLTAAGIGGTWLLLCTSNGAWAEAVIGDVYPDKALGMVIGDPARCVGCRRCESACIEFNEGFAQPSISRIKVARNYNFGPREVQKGIGRGEGRQGNHRIIQDTCLQCPHPVPCQLACPYGAIEVIPPVNARVVNEEKCKGCRTCQRACPWGMPSFKEDIEKSTKCHLCNGNPECVQACPTGALRYIPWTDRTKDIPGRFIVPAFIETPEDVKQTCSLCH
jgi:Fe-S-cluster-containing dehydrogenase component